jgi:Mobilization protein NikA
MTDALNHPGPASARETPAVIHLPDLRQRIKKVSSGSENRRRTTAVRVRLHPADAERLKTEAAAAGMSVAGYLASGRLGEEAAPRPRIHRRRVTADVAALLQALVDFNRADTLLNQAVRALNTLALFAEEHGTTRVLTEVRELRRTVDELRDKFDMPVAGIQAALADDREG